MKHQKQLATALLLAAACSLQAQRSETLLEKNWKFSKGDIKEASQPEFNDTQWESVVLPHDWAIFGPFDMNNDLQNVAITQNFEEKASLKTGRTGPLGQPAGFGDSHQTCLLVVHLGEHPQGVLQHFFPVCYHKRKGFMFLIHEGREILCLWQALCHYFVMRYLAADRKSRTGLSEKRHRYRSRADTFSLCQTWRNTSCTYRS